MSNAQDADLIIDPVFQDKFAMTIKNAVEKYVSLGTEKVGTGK